VRVGVSDPVNGNLNVNANRNGGGAQTRDRVPRVRVNADTDTGTADTDTDETKDQVYELDDYENVDKHVAKFLKRIYGVDKVDAYGRLLWKDHMAPDESWDGGFRDSSLFTYGEVLPLGVSKLMDPNNLDILNATVLFDIGCGRGRLAAQCFQQYRNLRYVLGIEKSEFRFQKCKDVAKKLHLSFLEAPEAEEEAEAEAEEGPFIVRNTDTRSLATTPSSRTLEFRHGDVADLVHVTQAMNPEVVVFNVCHKPELIKHFETFFQALNPGTRVASYENLAEVWTSQIKSEPPFTQINPGEKFYTTWERNEGHQFYLWKKI